MIKRWIVKIIKGNKIVVCPYCGYKSNYPTAYCGGCDFEVDEPDETIIKKEWW